MAVKLYRNDSEKKIRIPQLDLELKPGEQVSVSGEYLPPIITDNFPGLVDVEAEEAKEAEETKDKGKSK